MGRKFKKFIWLMSLIAVSCSEKSTNVVESQRYPFNKNSLLEYQSVLFIQFYDSTGNLSIPDDSFYVNTIVQLLSDTASVGSYKNAFLLVSSEVSQPNGFFKGWYVDSDSGLYLIAYSANGISANVLPKQPIILTDQISQKLKKLHISYFALNNYENTEDSVYVLDVPRKILRYPLFSGSRWYENMSPPQIERLVADRKTIEVPAGTFSCYKINRFVKDPEFKNVMMSDYIDLDVGLIKRELVSDSMITINEFGDTTGFFKFNTVSELVRKE